MAVTDKDTGQATPLPVEESKTQSWLSLPRELFYVDFLGSLVPGLFTVILGTVMVTLTGLGIYVIELSPSNGIVPLVRYSAKLIEKAHYEMAVATLVCAYVIGTAFFRQDPKRPDTLSAMQVWLSARPSERPGLAVQMDLPDSVYRVFQLLRFRFLQFWPTYLYIKYIQKDAFKKVDAQFPYLCMRCYLAARGLKYLIPYIPWCPEEERSWGNRTKMYINILKIRIGGLAARFGRDIVRNEAHVRLSTSVWYAATTLSHIGLACLILLSAVAVLPWRYSSVASEHGDLFGTFMTLIVITTLCWAMKRRLRACIHYMRVREVVYVLEAAHLANKCGHGFKIEDLDYAPVERSCSDCDHLRQQVPPQKKESSDRQAAVQQPPSQATPQAKGQKEEIGSA